jgi:hypothetical protein
MTLIFQSSSFDLKNLGSAKNIFYKRAFSSTVKPDVGLFFYLKTYGVRMRVKRTKYKAITLVVETEFHGNK